MTNHEIKRIPAIPAVPERIEFIVRVPSGIYYSRYDSDPVNDTRDTRDVRDMLKGSLEDFRKLRDSINDAFTAIGETQK